MQVDIFAGSGLSIQRLIDNENRWLVAATAQGYFVLNNGWKHGFSTYAHVKGYDKNKTLDEVISGTWEMHTSKKITGLPVEPVMYIRPDSVLALQADAISDPADNIAHGMITLVEQTTDGESITILANPKLTVHFVDKPKRIFNLTTFQLTDI